MIYTARAGVKNNVLGIQKSKISIKITKNFTDKQKSNEKRANFPNLAVWVLNFAKNYENLSKNAQVEKYWGVPHLPVVSDCTLNREYNNIFLKIMLIWKQASRLGS